MSKIVLEPLDKSSLGDWFATDMGRYALAWEQAQMDLAVEDVFGFNAVQLGLPAVDFLRANRMPARHVVGPDAGSAVRADFTHLPLASHSVDLLVLPHVLEFCADPHEVLREAERVLMPEGQIVIAGFNPYSLWGMGRLAAGRTRELPWRGEFIGLLRLRDWLKLLGFELNGGKFGGYAPPLRTAHWLRRFRFMEWAGERWWPIVGSMYVVRAVKRTAGMRLVTPAWRTRRVQTRALAAVARRDVAGRVGGNGRALRLVAGGPMEPTPSVSGAAAAPSTHDLRPDDTKGN